MNRRSFFKFLGIGAATAVVAPKIFHKLIETQNSKILNMYFYKMEYSLPPDVHNVMHFSVGIIKGITYRPNIERLNIGDYADLTESEVREELPQRFHAGRYRRIA